MLLSSSFGRITLLFAAAVKAIEPRQDSTEMIGDLIDGATSAVGRQVRDCLNGRADCTDSASKTYVPPGGLGSEACESDACCVWEYIQRDLVPLFTETNGACNSLARAAVRLGFHDAGAWSRSSSWGEADGSIILNNEEISRPENNGLQTVRSSARDLFDGYETYGVGAADLVQFMHNVATVSCPLGPRLLTYVGREDDDRVAEEGLIPNNTQSDSTFLIDLFRNKTFGTIDLASLIGAHSVAQQFVTDTTRAGAALDSTVGVWDTEFYAELLSSSSSSNSYKLPGDIALRDDGRLNTPLATFAGSGGQSIWNLRYSRAYVRLSLLGVNRINELTDCTKVLPNAVTTFSVSNSASPTPGSSAAGSSASLASVSMVLSLVSVALSVLKRSRVR